METISLILDKGFAAHGLQSGLLRHDTKTLVRNFLTAYQTLCLLTNPAAETKSIGWLADLPTGRQVFCSPSGLFHHDKTIRVYLSGLKPFRHIIVTQGLSYTYRVPIAPDSYRDGRQKTRHLDTPPSSGQAHLTSLNRRAVIG
jgi:hypothetical protein